MDENESTNKRIDDLKEYISDRFDALNTVVHANLNCKNCKNDGEFRSKFNNQWIHIGAIWGVIGIFFMYKYLIGK
jgi:hypothetical protein